MEPSKRTLRAFLLSCYTLIVAGPALFSYLSGINLVDTFMASLPNLPVVRDTKENVWNMLEQFYAEKRETAK